MVEMKIEESKDEEYEPEGYEKDYLDRLRLRAKTMKNYDGYGDIFTLEDFIGCCECGGFIDYDGFGYLATEGEVSDKIIQPSTVLDPNFKTEYTHVVWYNR